MRIGCLLVPDLPLRAELRAHPELQGEALVVASGADARAEVIAVSPEALAAGVRPGGTVTHARAVCAELQVRVASPAQGRAAREALLDIALSCSPRALLAPPGQGAFAAEAAVFLDASGVDGLFHSEQGFAAAIAARADAMGLPGAVCIAGSRSVARLAARRIVRGAARQESAESVCHVLAPGAEPAFLAPLPIDLLDPDDALAETLTRFGVRTVKDLLKLPRRQLAQRLGSESLRLVAQARGAEVEAPLPEPKGTRIEEATDLEYPVAQLEPLGFVLRGLLARLIERLGVRGLVCGPLDLHLALEGGSRDVRRIGVAAPTSDVRVLLRLVMLALETHPPKGAVERAALATEGFAHRRSQLDLFRPPGPDPAVLDRTLSELESLCGNGRVGAPEVSDDHRPDSFGLRPFPMSGSLPKELLHQKTEQPGVVAGGQGLPLVVRALRPPVAASVQVQAGLPSQIRSAISSGGVVHASGPWRTTGRWWSEQDRFAVDHYDVQVEDGTLLRLCFDWIRKIWRIDAIYD
jgi:protein ImuB